MNRATVIANGGTMPRYTPAPWVNDEGCVTGRNSNDLSKPSFDIFDAGEWHGIDAEGMANAHLISAAPDLLEALKWATMIIDNMLNGRGCGKIEGEDGIKTFEAAIAKAEGK